MLTGAASKLGKPGDESLVVAGALAKAGSGLRAGAGAGLAERAAGLAAGGAAFAGAGAGETPPGATMMEPHLGHFPFFPANSGGTAK